MNNIEKSIEKTNSIVAYHVMV